MNFQEIILGIGIIIGCFLFKKPKPLILIIIIITSFVSYILIPLRISLIDKTFYMALGVLCVLFSIYYGKRKKWLNLIISVFALATFFFKTIDSSYMAEFRLLLIIPMISFIFVLLNKKKYRKELSALTVFIAYQISEFFYLFDKLIR